MRSTNYGESLEKVIGSELLSCAHINEMHFAL